MIIIDLNSIGFAATAANPSLRAGALHTGGVFGVLRTLRLLRAQHAGKMIGLWDGRSWRYDHFPDYKGNRDVDPKLVALKTEWSSQKRYVAQALRYLGIAQLFAANMEADDLAARIVSSKKNVDQSITLVTGDKDWLQLVSPRVTWVDPIRERRCTLHSFKDMTKFDTPWQFIQAKALGGDAGDNVPPVGGIGPAGAQWIFDHLGSVDALMNESITGVSKDWPKKIRDFTDSPAKVRAYQRNLLLVWLQHPLVPATVEPTLKAGALDADAFTGLAEDLSFHSILRDPQAFLAPFTA